MARSLIASDGRSSAAKRRRRRFCGWVSQPARPERAAPGGKPIDPRIRRVRCNGVNLLGNAEIRKILLIKWSALGDVALATAAFEDIVRAFPDREVHLNTLPPWQQLFQHDPRFAKVFAFDLRGQESLLGGSRRWLTEVAAESYDAVFDLQTTDRSRLLLSALWVKGAPIRYRVGNKRGFPYNIAPAQPPPVRHALAIARANLAAAGIPCITEVPVLHYASEHRAHAQALQHEHKLVPGQYAIFLPGSQAAGYLKRWGAKRYADLARELFAAGLKKIAVIGGPDEIEECAALAADGGPDIVNLCGKTSILEIVPLAEGARFIVGNDTGTAHVAAAANRPMFIICGPTDPARVKPAGPNVETLQADLPCINCYRKTCSHHSCMAAITPEQVVSRLQL